MTILNPRAFEPHSLVPDISHTSRIAEWILGARRLGTKSNRQPIEFVRRRYNFRRISANSELTTRPCRRGRLKAERYNPSKRLSSAGGIDQEE